jgi:NAD(P)H-dependent FMN reductase
MPYFLSLSGSPSKFSRSGFLLRTIGSILEKRTVEFRAVHAVDLPPAGPATGNKVRREFIADTLEQISDAAAIALLTTAPKGNSPSSLSSLLQVLSPNVFADKPVLLFVIGGFPGHAVVIENALRPTLLHLGVKAVAARVHIATGNWIVVGEERPRLTRGAEREISDALEVALQSVPARRQGRLLYSSNDRLALK